MHVLGTRVPRCLGVARSASSPKAAQALGCSLTPGLRISFGRVTCMARAASVPRLWTLGFLLLRGAFVWVWVVVWLGFQLRPATPGWGVGVCVCLCACSACTPPLLAEVCNVDVCAWARVPAAPRHSWLGCWVVCFRVCVLRLHPATPGWGVRCGCVCFGSGFGCPPPFLAGVLGCVCACVRAPLVPRHSWLGCAARVLCLGSGLGGGPPLLAGVSGFVSACVRAPLAPCHSLLVCAMWVCVFGLGFRLRPATPGCGVGVCVLVCVLSFYPTTPGWGARCGCVCLGSGFYCAPPLVAGVLGCVCGGVGAPLVPRHSWLGCAFRVWVCGLAFRLRPATPGWGVGCACVCLDWGFGCAPPLLAGVSRCACLCACSPCTPPLLTGVCSVGVCAWVRVSAAPRHSWLGCWAVGVLLCALRLHPATPG